MRREGYACSFDLVSALVFLAGGLVVSIFVSLLFKVSACSVAIGWVLGWFAYPALKAAYKRWHRS